MTKLLATLIILLQLPPRPCEPCPPCPPNNPNCDPSVVPIPEFIIYGLIVTAMLIGVHFINKKLKQNENNK